MLRQTMKQIQKRITKRYFSKTQFSKGIGDMSRRFVSPIFMPILGENPQSWEKENTEVNKK